MEGPFIRCWSRSNSGLRVYWNTPELVGRRFCFAIEGNNLLLDQVADDNLIGNLVRARETYGGCEWRSYRLCGPRIYQPVKIMPLGGTGQIAYVIPDIPDLRVHSRRDDMAAKEAAKEPPPKPISPLPISPKPPLVPSAESLGLLGKNGSAGQIVTMQDYMCNVITAIDELEGHSPYRLMKGGNGWAWRAPDIRPKE